MIRVARISVEDKKEYTYIIDKTGKAGGRGAYVCKACTERATKTKALNRSFKTNVPNEIYADIIAINASNVYTDLGE